jgi:putative membrane-bound dehydrogenase-like protein
MLRPESMEIWNKVVCLKRISPCAAFESIQINTAFLYSPVKPAQRMKLRYICKNLTNIAPGISIDLMRPVLLIFLCLFLLGSVGKRDDGVSGLEVPEGYVIEQVVSPNLISYPMFASFDDRGRLFVFESTGPNTMGTEQMLKAPTYHVRLLEDTDGDGNFDNSHIFAEHIPFPKGGVFYQGSLYVSESPNLIRYTDLNDDGVSDKREVVLTGWTLHANGASLSGPFLGPDGWLYLPDARRGFNITTKEGQVLKGKGARIWRCRPDGTGLEAMAGGGFDNSIEIAFMSGGETIGTMTYFRDPQDGERDALMHWVEGGTYPKANSVIAEDGLKLTGELMPVLTKMPRVAPSGLMRYRNTAWGAGFQGNLFHAEFNTGRIIRHRIAANGATFKTQEEVFMKSSGIDSHPTDVLEDADGSILVVVTGGWFVEGCPLSRVAKPEVIGGIYRIRKKDAVPVQNPWGRDLDFRKMQAADVVKYLSDSRPFVRDQAVENLVRIGSDAVVPLTRRITSIKNEEMRAAAIFALSRIGTPAAMDGVREALNDKSILVRTAAARALGLAKDVKSLGKLMKLVETDSAAVRRQAATALGQIGDQKAVTHLLNAAGSTDDRFVTHSLIYSLISLASSDMLAAALKHPNWRVRSAAVIALDQKGGSELKKEHLAGILASDNVHLRNTGVWVASHHPGWTSIVTDFLKKNLKEQLSEEDRRLIINLMLTFAKETDFQRFVADQLKDPQSSAERKLLLLNVIGNASMKELPASWNQQLGNLLGDDDARIRSEVLNLIGSRRIKSMNGKLTDIVKDPAMAADFRLKALNARLMSSPELSEIEFGMITKFLAPENAPPVRQQAVRLLDRADLNDNQLLGIADQKLGEIETFLLPGLLEIFEGNKNEQVGKKLVEILIVKPERLTNLSEEKLKQVFSGFPVSVQQLAAPLMESLRSQHAERLAHLQKMEKELKGGDVGEGRKLFYGKATCYLCHSVGSQGGRFGPDLTNIGEIRSVHDILEAVVYPSASFAREYETSRITTKTGSYTGVIKEQLPEAIIIEVGPVPGLRIARSEILSIEPQSLSMMPPGLDQQLAPSEMADLTAFLQALPYRLDRMIQSREKR